jgi:hypothetical protein
MGCGVLTDWLMMVAGTAVGGGGSDAFGRQAASSRVINMTR